MPLDALAQDHEWTEEPETVECDGCGAMFPVAEMHRLRGRRLCAENYYTEAAALRAAVLDPSFTLSQDQLREVQQIGATLFDIDAEIDHRIRQRWAEHEREHREKVTSIKTKGR